MMNSFALKCARAFALMTLALAVCLAAGSCGKSSGPAKRVIGFCMTLDDPYWQNMRLESF